MVQYIHFFFSCRHCAENFALKVQSLGYIPTTPQDSILWLWQIHNMANNLLKGRGLNYICVKGLALEVTFPSRFLLFFSRRSDGRSRAPQDYLAVCRELSPLPRPALWPGRGNPRPGGAVEREGDGGLPHQGVQKGKRRPQQRQNHIGAERLTISELM